MRTFFISIDVTHATLTTMCATTFVAPANIDNPARIVHETVWIIPSVTVMHLLKSHYPELDTAIVCTALFGRIGVDRLRLAKALIL